MIIVKIGGGDKINLAGVADDLSELSDSFIVVHGANALRDEIAERLGIEKQIITSASGYSSVFSDRDALDAILMAYSGLRNKRIVELLQQREVNAIGLTGLDGRVVQGARNKGIRVNEKGKKMLKRDLSGKPRKINVELLEYLISKGYAPILTIPIVDESGTAINTENDDVVYMLQQALSASTVVQLIEAPGFLDDPNDSESIVPRMSREELATREQQVEGRMKRKMHALSKLANGNVSKIIISDGRVDHPVMNALNGSGTWIE